MSIYNHENNQTSYLPIKQLFVGFVSRPVGTRVNIFVNGTKVEEAIVLDALGTIYAKFPINIYTRNQDAIEIRVVDNSDGFTLLTEVFATSHIATMFEIQSDFMNRFMEDNKQIEENVSIEKVDDKILESKFGLFTKLAIRPDQTIQQYRAQTSCLWKSFQFASFEKSLIDSIRCLIGSNALVSIIRTRDNIRDRIFDNPQFGDSNIFDGITLARTNNDVPEFYIADIPASFRTEYDLGQSPEDVLGPYSESSGDDYDIDTVKQLTLRTTHAIGNEIVVKINELDASILIDQELVSRQPNTLIDSLGNINVLPLVTVTKATIQGVETVSASSLPIEDVDFSVDRISGRLTWFNPAGPSFKTPDDKTSYTITYRFRLDEPLRVVIQQIKPAYRSVVLKFADSDIQPWFSENFESLANGDLDAQGPWIRTAGAANTIDVTSSSPLIGTRSAQYNISGPAFDYEASMPSRQGHYDVSWKWQFGALASSGTDEVSVVMEDGGTLRWRLDMQVDTVSGAIVLRDGAAGVFTAPSLDVITKANEYRVVVTSDNVVKVFRDNVQILSGVTGANSFGDTLLLSHFAGGGTNTAKIDNIKARFKYPTSTLPIAIEV